MFNSIIDASGLTIQAAFICMIAAMILGLVIAYIHSISGRYSKNFIITVALLPLLVQIVIMMVNGNLGTSIAIVGAFTLIRFRSMPGNSRELISVFFAMAVGLAIGMGHLMFAATFTAVTSLFLIILTKTPFGEKYEKNSILKIIIPEDLDYTEVFDDILLKYTTESVLLQIKTTNMGSMYELQYSILLKNKNQSKDFIDELRVRNGNLNISLKHSSLLNAEL